MAKSGRLAADLSKELHELARDTEDLLAATGDMAGEQIAAVRSRAHKSLKSLRKGLHKLPDELSDQLQDAGEAASKAIRREPLKWVTIAAGVGLLIGLLSMSRSR